MKRIIASKGSPEIKIAGKPECLKRHVLVQTLYSSISPGTENSLIDSSVSRDINLGYSASGRVVELGEDVTEFQIGDLVAVYGAPYVGHREYLSVPVTLCAKVSNPDKMALASMSGLGSIAIHALRQANLQFGESIVVVGLGIYGQLIAQIGKQAGYQIFALNRSKGRANMLENIIKEKVFTDEKEMEEAIASATDNNGVDAVFICTGGDSDYLTNKSVEWLRDRGKSVIVGDVAPKFNRAPVFSKEVEILISRAGGPGRYDKNYELEAIDYPIGYVRWTEGRNVKEFVRLIEKGLIDLEPYFDNYYSLEEYQEAYNDVNDRNRNILTAIFRY